MLELLPKVQKKTIKKEYYLRLIVVAMLFLLMTGVLLMVSVSPSYFLSLVKKNITNKEIENIEKTNSLGEYKEIETEIKNLKETISLLEKETGNLLIKDLILKIISKKNSEVAISGISIDSSKNSQYQIFIKGISKSREALKLFMDKLMTEKEFSDVDLPISNFAKVANIDFNIIIRMPI